MNPEGGYGWAKYIGEKQLALMPGDLCRRRADLPRLRGEHLPETGQEPGHRLADQEGHQVSAGGVRGLGRRKPETVLRLSSTTRSTRSSG